MKVDFLKKQGLRVSVLIITAMLVVSPQVSAEILIAKVVGISDGNTVNFITDQKCESGKYCHNGKIQYRIKVEAIDKQPYGFIAIVSLIVTIISFGVGSYLKISKLEATINKFLAQKQQAD